MFNRNVQKGEGKMNTNNDLAFAKPYGHDIDCKPELKVTRDDFMERVLQAIERLPKEQRIYLKAYSIDEKSPADIAKQFGQREEHVKREIKRARNGVKRTIRNRVK